MTGQREDLNMARSIRQLLRRAAPFLALCAVLLVSLASGADDTLLFTSRVAPNVLLMIDNSNSMNEIMRHPASISIPPPGWPYAGCNILPKPTPTTTPFPYGPNTINDQSVPAKATRYDCYPGFGCWMVIDPSTAGFTASPSTTDDPDTGYITRTFCGQTRKIWHDGQQTNINGVASNDNPTWIDNDYLEWLFHLDTTATYTWGSPPTSMTGAQILADIDDSANDRHYIGGATYGLYQRSRITALREVARDVIYQINTNGAQYAADCRPGCSLNLVRFGIAKFTTAMNGGFVSVPIADYSTNWSALETEINNLDPATGTPLSETLFKLVTYFMPHDPNSTTTATRPLGVAPGNNGSTRFPAYKYDTTTGAYTTTASSWPPDPVQQACQKNFIVMITDGQPSGDDFTTSGNETQGFSVFRTQLVGNYAPDAVGALDIGTDSTPEEGNPPFQATDATGYLDDIAKAVQDIDIRPDLTGNQHIDIYTIGLATDPVANALLQHTATNGNGLFRAAWSSQDMIDSLVAAIEDILNKAQAFTSAAVPASRTTSAENFYTAFFVPATNTWYWEGHLKDFNFTQDGDITTSDGHCAVGVSSSAVPPCPANGTLRTTATGYWDAADQMPAPASRKLYVELGNTAIFAQPTAFNIPSPASGAVTWFGMVSGDLSVVPYNSLTSPNNTTTGAASALIQNLRGCTFAATGCTARVDNDGSPLYLGDIFHSNPVVVGSPNAPIGETTYQTFATNNATRTRVIYAGANDGFLHGFHAGTWQTVDTSVTPSVPMVPPRYDRGTGQELMGFMPYSVRKTVKNLIKTVTGLRTAVNVDGSPIVADVWFNRTYSGSALNGVNATLPNATYPKNVAQWRTVLMAGLRDGGSQYFALDITDPPASASTSTTTYPRYLWGFPVEDPINGVNPGTAGETAWMGNTWSEPVITRVKVRVNNAADHYERWVAVFGAGYSVEGDPNGTGYLPTSQKGRAIYMVDITTGEVLAKKAFSATVTPSMALATGERQLYSEMRYSIASSPAVFDLDFDGFADVIYIGDLGGNMWKWVVTAPGDDTINGQSTPVNYKNTAQPQWPFRLWFRGAATTEPPAEMSGGTYSSSVHYQSFFFPPTGAMRDGNLVLAFGAGERANPISSAAIYNDGCTFPIASPMPAACNNNNRFYVVKDTDPEEAVGTFPNRYDGRIVETCSTTPCAGEGDLANFDASTPISCATMNTTKKGYYIVGRDAEKFVSNSTIFLGKVFTGSFLQRDPASTDICSGSGTAYLYSFDIDCGLGSWPANGTDQADRRLAIGSGLPTRPRVSAGSGSGGGGGGGGGVDCGNKVVLVTSDGGLYNNSPGGCPPSAIKIRSWREQ